MASLAGLLQDRRLCKHTFVVVSINVGNGMKLNELKEKGSKSTDYFAFFSIKEAKLHYFAFFSIEEAKLHYKHCSLLYF